MQKETLNLSLAELEKLLDTDLCDGLSSKEARKRLDGEGKSKNVYSLFVGDRKNVFQCLLSSAEMPFLVLLLITSLLTAAFGRVILGLSVFLVALSVSALCVILSLKTRKTLNSARQYAAPMIRVRRNGNIYYTDSRNIVSGDLIVLGEGDLVPCDAKLIRSSELVVDELFIGKNGIEKRRVGKRGNIEDDLGAIHDDVLYAGSAIINGNATALAVAVGSDVILAENIPNGALGGRDTEADGIKIIKSKLYKVSFLCAVGLLILTLISLLTFKDKSYVICSFMMLLSSVFLINVEAMNIASLGILSAFISKLFKSKSSKKKLDNSAAVRNIKALDTLTDITDVVLVGSAGIGRGVFRVSKLYIAGKEFNNADSDNIECIKLLDLAYMFVKAQRKREADINNASDGITDALSAFLRNCNYDTNGAEIMVRSLYTAHDAKLGYDFAFVETDSTYYRTTFVDDVKAISLAAFIRDNGELRIITDRDRFEFEQYLKKSVENCDRSLICISQSDKEIVFEGILVLEQPADRELHTVISDINALGINVSVFMPDYAQDSNRIVCSAGLDSLFVDRIAYSTVVKHSTKGFVSDYSVYVGYSNEEYSSIITEMRKNGAKVAIYCVDNKFNEVMADADIAISCDVLKYSTEKHRESVYERIPEEGKDTSPRASQQTRLLSKVIVKRSHAGGGGLLSVYNVLKTARSSYIALGHSLLLFVLLMSSLLSFTSMTLLLGTVLLDPLQNVLLLVAFAFLSVSMFTDSHPSSKVLSQKINYVNYPNDLLKNNLIDIAMRAVTVFLVSITVKIWDAIGVFGDKPAYSLPIFLCLCFTALAEVYMINSNVLKRGIGKGYGWLKLIITYIIMIFTVGLSAQKPFSAEFYPNGIGSIEYVIIPYYILLYCSSVAIAYLIKKKRKNT